MTLRGAVLMASAALLAGCETIAEEATEAIGFEYIANLSPVTGSGSGKAEISINDATNQICGDIELFGLSDATEAHIHLGETGPAYVYLDPPDDDDSDDCDPASDELLDHIRRNYSSYYVDVHTPGGTVRGQLRKE